MAHNPKSFKTIYICYMLGHFTNLLLKYVCMMIWHLTNKLLSFYLQRLLIYLHHNNMALNHPILQKTIICIMLWHFTDKYFIYVWITIIWHLIKKYFISASCYGILPNDSYNKCLHDDLALNQQHSYNLHHDRTLQQTFIYLHHDKALYQPTLKICLHDDLALNHQTIIYLHHDSLYQRKLY